MVSYKDFVKNEMSKRPEGTHPKHYMAEIAKKWHASKSYSSKKEVEEKKPEKFGEGVKKKIVRRKKPVVFLPPYDIKPESD